MCLLVICESSFGKCLFMFWPFFVWVVWFLFLFCFYIELYELFVYFGRLGRLTFWNLQNIDGRNWKWFKKWKISDAVGLEELILIEWPYNWKQCTDSVQSWSKYPWHFSENEKKNHKILLNHKRTWIARTILWKKNIAGSITLPGLTILQSYSSPNNMELAQNRCIDQWSQNREPRNKPMCLWSINLQQKRQEYSVKKR